MHAEQILTLVGQPPWSASPEEREPEYFRVWQRVSIALQKNLRARTRELYFRDPARFADHDTAYTLIVFSASRPFYGRPRSEFTYDVADPATLPSAWRAIGNSLRTVLAPIERRLRQLGDEPLAHRYAPVWYQDVLVSVKRRPRPFVRLIALEAKLIDALIDLGTQRNEAAARRFHRVAINSLRRFHGDDMTALIPQTLEEAARVLAAEGARRGHNLLNRRVAEHRDTRAARSPHGGIA